MKDRDLKSYLEKAQKFVQKETEQNQKKEPEKTQGEPGKHEVEKEKMTMDMLKRRSWRKNTIKPAS